MRLEVPSVFAAIMTPVCKSVHYSVTDYIITLILSVVVGCDYNVAINHKLRPYPLIARLLGMRSFPDQSSVNAFLHSFTQGSLEELDLVLQILQQRFGLATQLPSVDLDIDATGMVVYGSTYEGAAKGYFPHQRGKNGYQFGLVSAAATGEALAECLLPGNLRPEHLMLDLIYGAAETLDSMDKIGLSTGDAGFGTEANVRDFQGASLHYLVKGRDPRTFAKRSKALREDEWEYAGLTSSAYELGNQKINPRSEIETRTILVRSLNNKGEWEYSHLYTDIPEMQMDAVQALKRYNQREEIESVNKIFKSALFAKHLRTREFLPIWAFLKLNLVTLNLLYWFRQRVLTPAGMGNLGIHDIVHRLMDVPGKMSLGDACAKLAVPSCHPLMVCAPTVAKVVSGISLKS